MDKNARYVDVDAIPGERWFPKETGFEDDLGLYWGDWGVASEVDTLRAVLLRRPGKEIENFDAGEYRFSDQPIDVELMRKQHDSVAELYRSHGVKVFYVEEQREDRPNAIFCRDLVFMTPEGAIITRPGMAARRGEERYIAKALADLGVPIVRTINGDGIFEGANAMWVDRKTVVLSTGSRCNRSGFEQVETELRRMGVTEVLHMQQPYSNIHIDGVMNQASNDVILIHASQVPYDVLDVLKKKGYKFVEAPSQTEVRESFGCNFVALEPGLIVMPEGNPRCQEALENSGIKVITIDISEILKGRGALHCITAYLKRG
ncbi:dimethylarginine dimethylaminohydrolase family protein [Bacilliculturomica massiliensis]|uniref:dimethylarginine dimethylaminohydrolase family protein n=1 Tax=Bacilliculturomica massiliensis TaxID=1917867 RepID=UPI00102F90DE|nr:arginine deiminase family protein [Bacilliculturomica massiliensis]